MERRNPEVDFWNILDSEDESVALPVSQKKEQAHNFSFANSFKMQQLINSADSNMEIPEDDQSVPIYGSQKLVELLEKVKRKTNENDIDYKDNEKIHILDIPCKLCDFKTNSKGHITKHLKKRHDIESPLGPINCTVCNYSSKQPGHLKRHMKSKHEGVRYPCKFCDITFSIKDSVRVHTESVHQQIKYPCPSCDFLGRRFEALKIHIAVKHSIETHECGLCSMKFKTKSHLNNHIAISHEGRRYTCEFKGCDYNAKDRSTLMKHMMGEHYNVRYSCTLCELNYSTTSTAKKHIAEKHPGASFDNIIMHEKEKRFSCNYCELQTASKVFLNRHTEKQHAELLKMGLLPCDYCDFEAKSKASLTLHKRYDHSIESPKAFACNLCDYIAKTVGHLKRHKMLKHDKDKPRIQCFMCTATFTLQASINKHMKRAHNNLSNSKVVDPYVKDEYELKHNPDNNTEETKQILQYIFCNFCDFKTKFSNSMRSSKGHITKHIKKCHPVEVEH